MVFITINSSEHMNYKFYRQWIATFGVFCMMMQVGIQLGWPSPILARLTQENSEIPLSPSEASWVVSSATLGGFLGIVIGLAAIEIIGSKKTVLLTFGFFSIVWICMIIANSPVWIYVGRVIGGVSLSLSYCSFPMFLGEISVPKVRGIFISLAASGSPVGVVIGTIAETYLPMQISSSIYLAQSVMMIMLFFWLMDSPYELVKVNRCDDARKSIIFYNISQKVDKELIEIKSFVEADGKMSFKDKLGQLKNPVIRKSLILITMLFALPHVSGTITILSYMEIILKNGKTNLIKPEQFVIYANITCAISTFVAMTFMDSFGRRFLLIVSSIGTCLSMLALGTHFYLLSTNFDAASLQWLPIVSIIMYLTMYSVGYGPVPSVVLSEIFPENCKSIAGLAASFAASAGGFAVSKSYQPMSDSVGEAYCFWMYAILSALGCFSVLLLLPETKRKTFQEIQDILAKR